MVPLDPMQPWILYFVRPLYVNFDIFAENLILHFCELLEKLIQKSKLFLYRWMRLKNHF